MKEVGVGWGWGWEGTLLGLGGEEGCCVHGSVCSHVNRVKETKSRTVEASAYYRLLQPLDRRGSQQVLPFLRGSGRVSHRQRASQPRRKQVCAELRSI